MYKIIKYLLAVPLVLMALNVNAGSTGDSYVSVGYSQSDAASTTTYGAFTKFDTATSTTLGFSTKLYDQYNFGLVVDLEELGNMNLLFGTENSRFRIRTSTVDGQLNGNAFEYDEVSYLWYLSDPEYSWGIIYGDYTTLAQHESYDPGAFKSDFIEVDISYVGWVRVSDAFESKKTGWGAQGTTGFVFFKYAAVDPLAPGDSSGFGIYVDLKFGYYKHLGRLEGTSPKSVLFAGINMEAAMDMTSEYTTPMSFGPSVTFSTKW